MEFWVYFKRLLRRNSHAIHFIYPTCSSAFLVYSQCCHHYLLLERFCLPKVEPLPIGSHSPCHSLPHSGPKQPSSISVSRDSYKSYDMWSFVAGLLEHCVFRVRTHCRMNQCFSSEVSGLLNKDLRKPARRLSFIRHLLCAKNCVGCSYILLT